MPKRKIFNKYSRYDHYLLNAAIDNKNLMSVKKALIHGADINETIGNGKTALMKAIENKQGNIAIFLINSGADIHRKNHIGNNALFYAVVNNNLKIVNLLIKERISLEEKNSNEETVLIKAIKNNADIEIIEALLNAGAKIKTHCKSGKKPLVTALSHGREDIAFLLLKYSSDVNETQEDGVNALMAASSKGYDSIVKILIDNDVFINRQCNKKGNTALINAILAHKTSIVEILLRHNAKINIKNNEGKTAFYLMFKNREKNKEIIEILKIEQIKRAADTAKALKSAPALRRDLKIKPPFKFK